MFDFSIKYYALVNKKVISFPDIESLMEWLKTNAESQEKARIIKQDLIGSTFVSTVFLGVDHSFSYEPHDPVVFETMIFDRTFNCMKSKLDKYQQRYTNYAVAEAGHAQAVGLVKKRNKSLFHFWRNF